jgi:D-sedoheptulose 7-phosphate isomerase
VSSKASDSETTREFIKQTLLESLRIKQDFLPAESDIEKAAASFIETFKRGGKLLICGNGGSAADSQHLAAELVGRYKKNRKGLPAIALSTDTSFLTAWANDFEYESIFERQIETLGKSEDALIAFSTSGNSKNILQAASRAKSLQMKVISFTGHQGGKLKELSDININVPTTITARIQENHLLAYHIICEIMDREFE